MIYYMSEYIVVKAKWQKGIVGWCIANTTGNYFWKSQIDPPAQLWLFEKGEDATAFKLIFG